MNRVSNTWFSKLSTKSWWVSSRKSSLYSQTDTLDRSSAKTACNKVIMPQNAIRWKESSRLFALSADLMVIWMLIALSSNKLTDPPLTRRVTSHRATVSWFSASNAGSEVMQTVKLPDSISKHSNSTFWQLSFKILSSRKHIPSLWSHLDQGTFLASRSKMLRSTSQRFLDFKIWIKQSLRYFFSLRIIS